MKIGVLSRQREIFPTHELLMEITRTGNTARFIPTTYVRPIVSGDGFIGGEILGEQLNSFDIIIPRIGRSLTDIGFLILQHLKSLGIPITLQPLALLNSRDKFLSYQILTSNKIAVPQTAVIFNAGLIQETLNAFNFPVVIKVKDSTHGIGCINAPTPKLAREVIEALLQQGEGVVLVQEYVTVKSRASHEDIRAFIIDMEVIGAMRRIAPEGEWRTNYALGARVVKHQITSEERELAIHACEALELEIAGVDLINTGIPKVLEVNACPGWHGLQKVTGIKVAQRIVEYALEKARK